MKEKLLNDDVS